MSNTMEEDKEIVDQFSQPCGPTTEDMLSANTTQKTHIECMLKKVGSSLHPLGGYDETRVLPWVSLESSTEKSNLNWSRVSTLVGSPGFPLPHTE